MWQGQQGDKISNLTLTLASIQDFPKNLLFVYGSKGRGMEGRGSNIRSNPNPASIQEHDLITLAKLSKRNIIYNLAG